MYSDQEFGRVLTENYPRWNSEMITSGFDFDPVHLKQVEGPLAPAARNFSQKELEEYGCIETTKKKKTVFFSVNDWQSSAHSQKGLSETDSFDLFNILIFIFLGEFVAFKLAERSFCKEVAYIQCNVKKDQFRHLIRNPEDVNYFEFDLMAAVKVYYII